VIFIRKKRKTRVEEKETREEGINREKRKNNWIQKLTARDKEIEGRTR
jgi:hypothetical protein